MTLGILGILRTLGGRRFVLTVMSGAGTFALTAIGTISGEVYATVTIATVAAYITGNGVQKWIESKSPTS